MEQSTDFYPVLPANAIFTNIITCKILDDGE